MIKIFNNNKKLNLIIKTVFFIILSIYLLIENNIAYSFSSSISETIQSASEDIILISLFQDDHPFSYTDENNIPQGLLVDYWKIWAKKTNTRVNFIITTRAHSIDMLNKGFTTICGALFETPERLNQFDFSKSIFESKTVFYAKNSIECASIDDLNTEVIGIIEGSLAEIYIQKYFPNLSVKLYKTRKELSLSAAKNELYYYILDMYQTENYISEEPGLINYHPIETIYVNKLKAAVKRGNNEILKKINSGILRINGKENTFLIDKWITQHKEKKHKQFYWFIITGICFCIMIIIIHTTILKRKINKKTQDILIELKNEQSKNKKNEVNIKELNEIIKQHQIALENSNLLLQNTIKKYESEIKNSKDILANGIKKSVFPIIENLKSSTEKNNTQLVNLALQSLEDICLESGNNIFDPEKGLTSRETEICNYIKNNLSNKEISNMLNISVKSVEKHRENIRKKLGITYQTVNLKNYFKKNS